MRVLLTSSGLETKELQSYFENMIMSDKKLSDIKALFIPTAAQYPDAITVLPKCMNDLLKCGIAKENISVYDLHYGMKFDELRRYDVVYLCGGSPEYLLSRINDTGWSNVR